ncbi:GNAT family N-acetyltransferase [Sporolactobacillus terrae]|uniref:GNAT family N-acetyltransferase n=1 Tax=Sporolactobacillus terrae TaxID=269673 RepID=UPI000687669B|nr:GNAT family N-acetyltransferase [Sporolactobacillus terrae]
MIIRSVNVMNYRLKEEIRTLEKRCTQADHVAYLTDLDDSLNVHKEMNHTFLCYEDKRLIAFSHLFVPTDAEAELSAQTDPEFRRQGYFSALLKRTLEEVKRFHIPDLLLVVQPGKIGTSILDHLGASYDFSEYIMSLDRATYHPPKTDQRLEIKQQTLRELERLIEISISSFGDDREEARKLIEMALLAPHREGYMAVFKKQIVGICYTRFDEGEAFLFGLGIDSAFQGKGLGKTFLVHLLDRLFSRAVHTVRLEVDSRNRAALNIYQDAGFAPTDTVNYYRMHVKETEAMIYDRERKE